MIKPDSMKYSITPYLLLLSGLHGIVSSLYLSLIFTFIGKSKSHETASHKRSVMEETFLQHSFKEKNSNNNFSPLSFQRKMIYFSLKKSYVLYIVSETKREEVNNKRKHPQEEIAICIIGRFGRLFL